MKPYTYLLHHKPTNTFYYGVRWAKDCCPSEFWIKYFTRSKKLVPLLRTLFGDDSFEFEIRRTFNNSKKAIEWEKTVLRRIKVIKKPSVWLNRTDNKAIHYEFHPLQSKGGHSKKSKELISLNHANVSGKNNPNFGNPRNINGKRHWNFGKILTNNTKEKIRLTKLGKVKITNEIRERFILKTDILPIGWKYGRTLAFKLKHMNRNKNV